MVIDVNELEKENVDLLYSLGKLHNSVDLEKVLLCVWMILLFVNIPNPILSLPFIINLILLSISITRTLVLWKKIRNLSIQVVMGNILIKMIRKDNIKKLTP